MSEEIEIFLNKIDAFAEGLDETEQAMLTHLIQDEPDDVAGFSQVRAIAPMKIANLRGMFSSGHTSGNFTAPVISGGATKGEI